MKQLFWKEWRELRLLPLAAALCMGLLVFGARELFKDPNRPAQFSDTFPVLNFCWALFGLLSAAPLFSQEVSGGSLMLLSALPVSRRRIWGVKALTGFGVMVLCLLTSAVVWAVMCAVLFGHRFFDAPLWHERAGDFAASLGTSFLFVTLAFAGALAVSPFLDRPLSVFFAALVLFGGVFVTAESLSQQYATYFRAIFYRSHPFATHYFGPHLQDDGAMCLLVGLIIPVFVAVSYYTFTRGEQLRSAKRFRVGALVGSASLTVAALTFCFGSCLHWW